MVLGECGGTHATLFLVEEFNSANKQAHELCGPIGDLRVGGCQPVAVRFRHVGRQQYINIVATVAELQGNIQCQQLLSCKSIILKTFSPAPALGAVSPTHGQGHTRPSLIEARNLLEKTAKAPHRV